jgi:hypothetical protein
MLVPAIHSTEDPPIPLEDLRLREYVYALRRRIEVQNILVESLHEEIQTLKTERNKLADQLEATLLDLHWTQSKRKIPTL